MEEFLNKCQLLDSHGFSKEIDQIDNNLIKIAQGVVKKPVSLESRLNLLEQKIKKMEQALKRHMHYLFLVLKMFAMK